ncbi:DUF1080 domain-containing protein [uncultured Arcticibacterium sp.]|uniref:3-keto-disaccharide hydrolase n=1 Tax=uncultured Arcticibacterium sp. TaxID=2173042 RepID=UPI0030F7574E
MKYINLTILSLLFLSSCTTSKRAVSLFNGASLSGWHIDVPAMDKDKDARNPFLVRNGMLVTLGTPGGHLITDASFSNYRMELEYRFVGEPGNCGALVHVSKPRRLYAMFPQSVEVQLMHKNAGDFWCIGENIEVPNMEARRGPKENWGVDGKKNRRIPNLTGNMENELGEWNFMQIECFEDQVKVWLNGKMVNHGFNATATSGSFALQSEGSEVEFRKVMYHSIKKLSKD